MRQKLLAPPPKKLALAPPPKYVPLSRTPEQKKIFRPQAVTPVGGELIKIAGGIPNALRKRIERGFFTVFVDWSENPRNGFKLGRLRGLYRHGRALSLNYFFKDEGGTRHNYLDIKGLGMPRASHEGAMQRESVARGFGKQADAVLGLFDYNSALRDWAMSETFAENGVKTYKPIAIIKLNEVVDKDGNHVSVEKAKANGIIPKNFEPVLYLRAMHEETRASDLNRGMVAALIKANKKRWRSGKDYVLWLNKESGRNLARIHDAGFAHRYYSAHNVTVDGRTIDHEAVTPATIGLKKDDIRVWLLTGLYSDLTKEATQKAKQEAFFKAYFENRKRMTDNERRELENFAKGPIFS